MEAICAALSGRPFGQDESHMRLSLSTDRLVRARIALSSVWDYFEKDARRRGKALGKNCMASVNRTTRHLNELDKYKEVGLRQIFDQSDGLVIQTRTGNGVGEKLGDLFGKMGVK